MSNNSKYSKADFIRFVMSTVEHESSNKEKAKERIYVEHSICGIKRYRILSDRLRIHDSELYDDILEICAGLWNFLLHQKRKHHK